MTEEQKANIQKMEGILQEADLLLGKARALLADWKALQPQIQSLTDYYHSPQWQRDCEASNQDPPPFPHGVLSEDAVYRFLAEQNDAAVAYIKWMAEILERN